MREALVVVLMLVGTALVVVAALGMVRLPDLFTRMQGATKAGSLGIVCVLLAVAVFFSDLGVTANVLLVIGFVVLTAPVAAHAIARAAYLTGIPVWKGTRRDELRERARARALLHEVPRMDQPEGPAQR